MNLYYQKAIQDMLGNRFLNIVTVVIIALSIFIVSTVALFIVNINDIMHSWEKGIRIMVYLKANGSQENRIELEKTIRNIEGVAEVRFISKQEALSLLQQQMKGQPSLFEDLKENPLPDAFEIRVTPTPEIKEKVEVLASRLNSLPLVDEVEYGQRWLGRFSNIVHLFRVAAYAMGILFFMASTFIVANTIRLVLYARREEIEIMRLVGASDRFIKAPFYIEGIIHGAVGGTAGLVGLFFPFVYLTLNMKQNFTSGFFQIKFLPLSVILLIIACSMFVGWLGCYLSLKQFLK